MDSSVILLAVLVLALPLATLLLRANGVLVFLAVCLGSVLSKQVGGDISTLVAGSSNLGALSSLQWSQLGLASLPAVMVLFLTRKTTKGLKLVLGFLAALAGGGLLALLAAPYLPRGVQESFDGLMWWQELNKAQAALLLEGTVITMLFLLLSRPKSGGDEKHSKHHK